MQVRRTFMTRGRGFWLAAILALAPVAIVGCSGGMSGNPAGPSSASPSSVGATLPSLAAPGDFTTLVQTDKDDYSPGSVVTISGDNSNGAGYIAGETVVVNVTGPNGYAASCQATVAANGSWSCQVTLWDDGRAIGPYAYIAVGQTSGVTETGTFTDARQWNLTFAGTGGGSVAIAVSAGSVNAPAGCGGTGTAISSQTVTSTCDNPTPGRISTSDNGATITLTATPNASSTFGGWSGVSGVGSSTCSGTTNPCTLVFNSSSGGLTVTFNATAPPSNTAPTIDVDEDTVTVDEGDTATNTGPWADADAGDTVTLSVTAGPGTVTKNDDGTWSWSFDTTDGPSESATVTIKADDGEDSAEVSFGLVVENVDPVVEKPEFSSTLIACNSSVTLTKISFSDKGVNDDPWGLKVIWGDGSDSSSTVNDQGDQSDQTHTYTTPDTYTATVEVTDKDDGVGSNTSSNQVQVYQYSVDFLPPFDDSSSSGLIVNKMKNGRVVPVKARILDLCSGTYLTDPSAEVTITLTKTSGSGSGDPIEEYADAGESSGGSDEFRLTDDDFWIYNLDSRSLGLILNNFYRVDVYVDGEKATITNWAVLQPVK